MKQVQAYVGIRGSDNVSELADVPGDKMALFQQIVSQPVHLDYRVNHTRWVVLRYPNAAMAQLANMSTEAFEDFYFRVCTWTTRACARPCGRWSSACSAPTACT